MSFLKRLRKTAPKELAPMPTWEQIIEIMYDKQLSGYADQVIEVIYSKDKTKRYLITKNEDGLLSYKLEVIYPFDEEEWRYASAHADPLPAMWEPLRGAISVSLFAREEDLYKQMCSEPEFLTYFE